MPLPLPVVKVPHSLPHLPAEEPGPALRVVVPAHTLQTDLDRTLQAVLVRTRLVVLAHTLQAEIARIPQIAVADILPVVAGTPVAVAVAVGGEDILPAVAVAGILPAVAGNILAGVEGILLVEEIHNLVVEGIRCQAVA